MIEIWKAVIAYIVALIIAGGLSYAVGYHNGMERAIEMKLKEEGKIT